ncbi:hypothetical protein STSP2_00956 [Anaerohalosphaera lusitana]|uniref:Uncharacterized protein n=1 Tax=Anaerohalosphaera lusitana TaxID=1936003 RepID=A0A1U9NJX2_9BACT|nr:hypothetical protein [Anaerohalosphaera lusitana]AQT67806.1 hypothetical protein STSP2_00956 [Anaerohalosphaera lusitana]
MKFELNAGDVCVSLYECDSRSELEERLRRVDGVVLLDEEQSGSRFVLVEVQRCGGEEVRAWGMDIVEHGPSPQMVVHGEECLRWVAFGSSLWLVDVWEARVVKYNRLDCVFWDIVRMDSGAAAVVHELGVTAYDAAGERLWDVSGSDMLAGFEVEDERILCRFDDGTSAERKLSV